MENEELLEVTLWLHPKTYQLNRNFLNKISEGKPAIKKLELSCSEEMPSDDEIIDVDDFKPPKKRKLDKEKEKEKL